MKAVILAGGLGTRLAARLGGLPKVLAPIGGMPLLEHHIRLCVRHGAEQIQVMTGIGAAAVAAFCGDGDRWGVPIECIAEPQPLGTAGAVLAALDRLPPEFVVLYGDTMVNLDLSRLLAAHRAAGAAVTLLVHPNEHPHDSDLVEIDRDGRILAFHPYPHPPQAALPNLVNAALYVVQRDALRGLAPRPLPFDFGKHVFPELLRRGTRLQGYRSPEYVCDAGTPERLDRVARDFAEGVIARASLEKPRPAVFLDRDGTLNEHVGHLASAAQLRLLPGVSAALRRLRAAGYRLVVLTNQPVVARGLCSEEELQGIHHRLETELGKGGAFLDGLYYCPHHPDKGFPGERPELKVLCDCRKPRTGMIRQATAALNIDLSRSLVIGDSTRDIEMARRGGLTSFLVETGEAGLDGCYPRRPDFTVANLAEAADLITRRPGQATVARLDLEASPAR